MALVWMDGFEGYDATNNLLAGAYISLPSNASYAQAGRFGSGKALRLDNALDFLKKSVAQTNTLTVGIAVKSASSASNPFCKFLDVTGFSICTAFISPDGAISLVRGSSFTTNILLTSGSGAYTFNAWNYVEVEFTRHASAGAVKIWVNGAVVAQATGLNTGSAAVATVSLGDPANTAVDFDDYYITDTAAHLGEIRIDTIVPNADTAQKDFTASTGTDNYAMVDELPVDSDTTYVVGDTLGQADLYGTAGLVDTPNTILAVQVRACAKKTDTGLRTLKTKMDSGGVVADGIAAALNSTYSILSTQYQTDPNTSAAWTASGVNALKIGMEIAT